MKCPAVQGFAWFLTEQTQMKEIEENSKNEEISEPIYVNVNGRKQTAPVKLEDLHAYILKNKENNCDGFRKEFEVRWTEPMVLVLEPEGIQYKLLQVNELGCTQAWTE